MKENPYFHSEFYTEDGNMINSYFVMDNTSEVTIFTLSGYSVMLECCSKPAPQAFEWICPFYKESWGDVFSPLDNFSGNAARCAQNPG